MTRSARTLQASAQSTFGRHALGFHFLNNALTAFILFCLGSRTDFHGVFKADPVSIPDIRGTLPNVPGGICCLGGEKQQKHRNFHTMSPRFAWFSEIRQRTLSLVSEKSNTRCAFRHNLPHATALSPATPHPFLNRRAYGVCKEWHSPSPSHANAAIFRQSLCQKAHGATVTGSSNAPDAASAVSLAQWT